MSRYPYNHGPSRALKALKVAGMVVGGIALAVVFALAFGWLVMILWNWLMPSLFGLKEITYWQGFGLVILAKLLFGAVGSHRGSHDHFHKGRKPHAVARQFIEECPDEGDEDTRNPGESHDNRSCYADYWRTEGKAAFEKYLARMKASSSETPDTGK